MQPPTAPTGDQGTDVRPAATAAGEGATATPQDTAAVRPAPVSVTVCPDGPLLVRGPVEILDDQGRPGPRRRRTVALCRCGATGLAPYCDGSHRAVGWRG